MKEWVYDLTVESTKNFMGLDCVIFRDTFHLAGVASKSNVTRGVPRINELLNLTRNPKSQSLVIALHPDFEEDQNKSLYVKSILQTVKTALDESFILLLGSVFFDTRGSCVNYFLNSSMQGIRALKK